MIPLLQSLGVPKSDADYTWFVNASHHSQDKENRINNITSNLVHERNEILSICNW